MVSQSNSHLFFHFPPYIFLLQRTSQRKLNFKCKFRQLYHHNIPQSTSSFHLHLHNWSSNYHLLFTWTNTEA